MSGGRPLSVAAYVHDLALTVAKLSIVAIVLVMIYH
jgi:hypothetical protein